MCCLVTQALPQLAVMLCCLPFAYETAPLSAVAGPFGVMLGPFGVVLGPFDDV